MPNKKELKANKHTSFIRSQHDEDHPYTNISDELLRDTSISTQAMGVLVRILSYPDNYKPIPSHLAKAVGVCLKTFYKILKELIKAGYVFYEQNHVNGKFGKGRYVFSETKCFKEVAPDCASVKTQVKYNIKERVKQNDESSNLGVVSPGIKEGLPNGTLFSTQIHYNTEEGVKHNESSNLGVIYPEIKEGLTNGTFLCTQMHRNTKEEYKEYKELPLPLQVQNPDKFSAAVFLCLKNLAIPEKKKIEISKFPEDLVLKAKEARKFNQVTLKEDPTSAAPVLGNPPLLNTKSQNTKELLPLPLQVQAPDKFSAVVFLCLKNLAIPEKKKIEISKFPEDLVLKAVEFTSAKGFKLKKTLEAALLWAIKEKPWLSTTRHEVPHMFKVWVQEINIKLEALNYPERVILTEDSVTFPIYHSQYKNQTRSINKSLAGLQYDHYESIKEDVDLYCRVTKSLYCK